MPRADRTLRRPLVIVATLVVAVVAGACSEVSDRLNSEERERFIEASNQFVDAVDQLDARYLALGDGALEVPEFVTAAADDVDDMEVQVAEIEELAEDVSGDPEEIATAAAAAAADVVTATRDIIDAIDAGDEAALQAGIEATDSAIDAFNAQITAWNDLVADDDS